METQRPIVVWNYQRSYPAIPEGYYNGTLLIDQNGMAFKGDKGEEIIIPWEHLTSTVYSSRIMRDVRYLAFFLIGGILAPPFGIAFLLRPPMVGIVGVRWRDKEYDRVCDIELVIPPDFQRMGIAGNFKRQAEVLDSEIWEARKTYRRVLSSPPASL